MKPPSLAKELKKPAAMAHFSMMYQLKFVIENQWRFLVVSGVPWNLLGMANEDCMKIGYTKGIVSLYI